MKIVIATEHFPPFIGGAHRWSDQVSSGLATLGHEVAVLTTWHGGLPRRDRHGPEQVPVYRVRQVRTVVPWLVRDSRQRHAPPFPDPVSVYELRRVLRELDPDVVLSHGWLSYSVIPALYRTGIPLALSAHDYGYFCATRRLLHRGKPCTGPGPVKCLACASDYYGPLKGAATVAGVAAGRPLAIGGASGLQSNTPLVDRLLARHLLGRHPAAVERFVIPPFLEEDGGAPRADLDGYLELLPPGRFILFAGAFRLDKGLQVLFDAYARLQHPPPLVLIGTMERDTPPFPPGAVVITDASHAAVIAAMARATLVVVPSILPEPLGMVAIEAISQGAPTIGTAPSGMADVLRDGAGLVVAQGDPEALAEAMRSVLADQALRDTLARRGPERAAEFKRGVVLERYEQMLARLAEGRSAARRAAGGLPSRDPQNSPRR